MKPPKILTEEELEMESAPVLPVAVPSVIDGSGATSPATTDGPSTDGPTDKINNLIQKENNLKKAGVTRRKAYSIIYEAMEATKWADVTDEQGNVKRELIADVQRRQWGAEMAIKMFGDMIERKEIEHDLGDKTLDRFRALTVEQLKAKAAEIIAGKPIGRLPAIDV